MKTSSWRSHQLVLVLVSAALLTSAPPPCGADGIQAGRAPAAGIEHMTGKTVALDVVLHDETGRPVRFGDLVDRPTLLVFVYYRCPSICDPMLRELAHALASVTLPLGERYRVVTVSFDPAETAQVAATKKGEITALLPQAPPADAWRFLTGDEAQVRRLTESTGFVYHYDARSQVYVHASSLIFLTSQGRIVRYLEGLRFLPAQVEMALADASTGTERDVMQSAQLLCYDYDQASNGYVLRTGRLALAVSGVLVALVLLVLVPGRKNPPTGPDPVGREDAP